MIKQNTPEWLEMRKNYVGASDAPAIMGVSPWATPYQKWEEKLGLNDKEKNQWIKDKGHQLEEPARMAFEKMTGLLTDPDVKIHPSINYMMASIDGVDVEGKAIVEIKYTGKEDHNIAQAGKVPEKYFPQLQHQLEVCGLDMAYYFSFDGQTGVIVKVFRDEKYIKELLQKEKEFWECVQELKEPPLTERDYVKKTDKKSILLANSWKDIKRQLDELEMIEKGLRNQLIEKARSQNMIVNGVKVSRSLRKGAVDYKMIPDLQNIDLEPYRKKPVECWRVTEK